MIPDVNYKQVFYGLRADIISRLDTAQKVLEHQATDLNKQFVIDFVFSLIEKL